MLINVLIHINIVTYIYLYVYVFICTGKANSNGSVVETVQSRTVTHIIVNKTSDDGLKDENT